MGISDRFRYLRGGLGWDGDWMRSTKFANRIDCFSCGLALLGLLAGMGIGQPVDPPPYAPIASPLSDTLDKLYRDSLNLRISKVRVNQAGNRPDERKFFYVVVPGGVASGGAGLGGGFSVHSAAGAVVGSGSLAATGGTVSGRISVRGSNNAQLTTGGDTRYVMTGPEVAGAVYEGELPALAPGRYRVAAGGDTSAPFTVDERV